MAFQLVQPVPHIQRQFHSLASRTVAKLVSSTLRVYRRGRARIHSMAGSRPAMYASAVGGTSTSGAKLSPSPATSRWKLVEYVTSRPELGSLKERTSP